MILPLWLGGLRGLFQPKWFCDSVLPVYHWGVALVEETWNREAFVYCAVQNLEKGTSDIKADIAPKPL